MVYQAANTPAAFTSPVALSQRCRGGFFWGGRVVFQHSRREIPAQSTLHRYSYYTAQELYLNSKSRAAEFQIFLHFIAVGEDDEQPIFPATSRPLVCSSS